MTDDKLQIDTTEWIKAFMRDRFPCGLPAKVEEIMLDVLVDAYVDGVRYGQEVVATESRLILPGR